MPESSDYYYILQENHVFGPAGLDKLKSLAARKMFDEGAMVSRDCVNWRPLSEYLNGGLASPQTPLKSPSASGDAGCAFAVLLWAVILVLTVCIAVGGVVWFYSQASAGRFPESAEYGEGGKENAGPSASEQDGNGQAREEASSQSEHSEQ